MGSGSASRLVGLHVGGFSLAVCRLGGPFEHISRGPVVSFPRNRREPPLKSRPAESIASGTLGRGEPLDGVQRMVTHSPGLGPAF